MKLPRKCVSVKKKMRNECQVFIQDFNRESVNQREMYQMHSAVGAISRIKRKEIIDALLIFQTQDCSCASTFLFLTDIKHFVSREIL